MTKIVRCRDFRIFRADSCFRSGYFVDRLVGQCPDNPSLYTMRADLLIGEEWLIILLLKRTRECFKMVVAAYWLGV